MLWSADEIVRSLTFALQKQIGLSNCVGFSVNLLDRRGVATLLLSSPRFRGECLPQPSTFLRATGTVVEEVSARFNFVRDG